MSLEHPPVASEWLASQPLIAALFDYWETKRGDRLMPDRRDIDPTELPPKLLPHLILGEISDGGARFRYRLTGTEITRRLGFDPTGKYADEILRHSYLGYVGRLTAEICRTRSPVYSESLFRWDERRHLFTRRLWLPLSRHGIEDTVAVVLAAQTFETPNAEHCEPLLLQLDPSQAGNAETAKRNPVSRPSQDG